MVRRRYIFRDRVVTAKHTADIGTFTARAMFVLTESNLDYVSAMALVCVAHHADLMAAAGQSQITYPEDLADLFGCAQQRAGILLRDLSKHGMVRGSAQGGYSLAGPMVNLDPED